MKFPSPLILSAAFFSTSVTSGQMQRNSLANNDAQVQMFYNNNPIEQISNVHIQMRENQNFRNTGREKRLNDKLGNSSSSPSPVSSAHKRVPFKYRIKYGNFCRYSTANKSRKKAYSNRRVNSRQIRNEICVFASK